ncbi:MAG: methylmalonyl-CoA mutase family protein, partial [Bacteroidota bacterium]
MTDKENLFSSFPPISKEEWLQKVTQDLKGRPFEELIWEMEDGIQLAPFYHPEDQQIQRSAIESQRLQNQWSIAEQFRVNADAYSLTNQQALRALMGGTEALQFDLKELPSKAELEALLEDISLSFISTHFNLEQDTAPQLIPLLIQLVEDRREQKQRLRGSLHFGQNWWKQPVLFRKSFQLLHTALPQFKLLTIEARREEGEGNLEDLVRAIEAGRQFLDYCREPAVEIEQPHRCVQFSIFLGNSYFVEMARIRALRLLWANVLQ